MADKMRTGEVMTGRVWRFDHDISTDLLSPGAYAIDPVEVRKLHVLESINPSFAAEVESGDVLVAGRNFGCGSSRETAAENLKVLGVACVVAESFASDLHAQRGCRGSCLCSSVPESMRPSPRVRARRSIYLRGWFAIPTPVLNSPGDSLPQEMREILTAGGILAVLRESTGQHLSL